MFFPAFGCIDAFVVSAVGAVRGTAVSSCNIFKIFPRHFFFLIDSSFFVYFGFPSLTPSHPSITLSHSLKPSLTLAHFLTLSPSLIPLSLSLLLTLTHTLTHSLSLLQSLPPSLTLYQSYTYSITHSLTLTVTH